MKPVLRVDGTNASAIDGKALFDWKKVSWNGSMLLISIFIAPFYFSLSAFLVFLGLGYLTLLIGHSVSMHRMMIHRTFQCPKPVERCLIYIGVLVGMGGPFSIIKIHDLRDWAQRQPDCHDYFSHKKNFLRDLSWQLFYRFEFDRPPNLSIEAKLQNDPWISFFEHTWRFHQLLLAIPLFWLGGLSWVVWGICVRVSISVVGHWTITYFCHNPGPGTWIVKNAAVQASNLPLAGFLSHGECWHNNHHAFPESAKIGLEPGQIDTGWRVIQILQFTGLATKVGIPRTETERDDLIEFVG